jgi:hypothetical protein
VSTARIQDPFPGTPDFIKSIPVWKRPRRQHVDRLRDERPALPHWNGFRAHRHSRWTATYWMKHVTVIAHREPYDGFWVKSAYRIPRGRFR